MSEPIVEAEIQQYRITIIFSSKTAARRFYSSASARVFSRCGSCGMDLRDQLADAIDVKMTRRVKRIPLTPHLPPLTPTK